MSPEELERLRIKADYIVELFDTCGPSILEDGSLTRVLINAGFTHGDVAQTNYLDRDELVGQIK